MSYVCVTHCETHTVILTTAETDASDPVPSITVEDVAPAPTPPPSKKGKKENKTLTIKPEKKLPDQGVTLKGSFLRKKPGLSRSWEKTYCVLTYQAFYFSNEADTKDYSNMLPIYPNMDVKLESRKGKGDNPVSSMRKNQDVVGYYLCQCLCVCEYMCICMCVFVCVYVYACQL